MNIAQVETPRKVDERDRGTSNGRDSERHDRIGEAELELLKCVYLQFALCWAAGDADLQKFARGIVDVLLWSADHARDAALARARQVGLELPDWPCPRCGEDVPANFDVCWNCRTSRTSEEDHPIRAARESSLEPVMADT